MYFYNNYFGIKKAINNKFENLVLELIYTDEEPQNLSKLIDLVL
jgi:hypothetical protein